MFRKAIQYKLLRSIHVPINEDSLVVRAAAEIVRGTGIR
jgi:hypothetical protein